MSETGSQGDTYDEWIEGAELVDDLIELQDAYNSYLATTNGVSQVGITDQEAQKYKGEVLQILGGMATDDESPGYEAFLESLDEAYQAALDFNEADPEERLEFREQYPERYDTLVQASPSRLSIDSTPLMQRFMPDRGGLYRLSRKVLEEGAEVLDEWVEAAEEEFQDEPPTTPEEREETADRMFA